MVIKHGFFIAKYLTRLTKHFSNSAALNPKGNELEAALVALLTINPHMVLIVHVRANEYDEPLPLNPDGNPYPWPETLHLSLP